jgi:hypothetical protein
MPRPRPGAPLPGPQLSGPLPEPALLPQCRPASAWVVCSIHVDTRSSVSYAMTYGELSTPRTAAALRLRSLRAALPYGFGPSRLAAMADPRILQGGRLRDGSCTQGNN